MRLLIVALVAATLAVPSSALAVEIHAHRGGTLAADGTPLTFENSLSAFKAAHAQGFVVELDVKLTASYQRNPGEPPAPGGKDGPQPIVMHDATLDRTTSCGGEVRRIPWNQLGDCHITMLGTDDNCEPQGATCRHVEGSTEPIPTLEEVLAWAKASGARLNIEIKNVPTDPDFDASETFAYIVVATLNRSGIPKSQVIVQSFWPRNLDHAKAHGWITSLLTLNQMNEGSPVFAALRGYEWVSPGWPLRNPAAFVEAAHGAGRKVVPYTVNAEADIAAALAAGVDGIISDRPTLVESLANPAPE